MTPRAHAAIDAVRAKSIGRPLKEPARIVLHFHPDALVGGRPTLDAIVADGLYRSQFETGTGNGGLTAVPGGDRWRWEHDLFAGAYDEAPAVDRPKYGSLQLDGDAYGASPRFGSCYFRLAPESLERATFNYPDSFFEPSAFGVADRFDLDLLLAAEPRPDPLDRYIEAHVHDAVRVPDDVEALVLDPSYAGTAIETAARQTGCAVEWHPGYVLTSAGVTDDYRGPAAASAARIMAERRPITPQSLGEHRRDLEPQTAEHVWHLLARFGRREAMRDPD